MKHTLVGPIEEATCRSVPFLEKGADLPLTMQGCTFVRGEKKWNSYVMIIYPSGSKRQELSPSRTNEARFLVTFPTGFAVLEVMDRNGVCKGLSLDLPTREA